LRGRVLKQRVFDLLSSGDLDRALKELLGLPLRKVLNPLFSLLYSTREEIKWRAVTAMGVVVAALAREDMEEARVVVRRLMWNLNDESGGVGWGSPEAFGEILARNGALAREYAPILISYARKDGNYLEMETLQRGLLWGLARLSQVRPHLMQVGLPHLLAYLDSPDHHLRGLCAWLLGLLRAFRARTVLEALARDESSLTVYRNGRLENLSVGELAQEALERMTVHEPGG